VFNTLIPKQIKNNVRFRVPISMIVGKAIKDIIMGRSRLRKIVKKTILLKDSLGSGSVSYHLNILPDIIIVVLNIPKRKKLKNWSEK